MTIKLINLGTTANDGTGDTLRVGGGQVNLTLQEIYDTLGDGTTLQIHMAGGSTGDVLTWNNANNRFEALAMNIVLDTSPSLGGNLDINGQSIITAGGSNANITITPNGTGETLVKNLRVSGNQPNSINFNIADESSSTISVGMGQTLKVSGNQGIVSQVSGDTLDISIDSSVATRAGAETLENKTIATGTNTITEATTSAAKGIANFEVNDFTVNAGHVELKTGGIANAKLTNSDIKILDDSSTVESVDLGETLEIKGGPGVSTTVGANEITIAASGITNTELDASAGILNTQLASPTITLGATAINLGDTVSTVAGFGVSGAGGFDLTGPGQKMRFNFASAGVRPDPNTYQGMFITQSDTAQTFYAESGSWIEILTENASIGLLSNVDITTQPPRTGQVLVFNSSNGKFAPANAPTDTFMNAVADYDVTTSSNNYLFGDWYAGNNPTIYVRSGTTICFNIDSSGHPFRIQTEGNNQNGALHSTGLTHAANDGLVSTGVSAQSKTEGQLYWEIPIDAVGDYYYQCGNHQAMYGKIVVQSGMSDAWQIKDANFGVESGGQYLVDCSGSPITVTLLSTPVMGDMITLVDAENNAGVNNITISRNGANINGAGSDLTLNTGGEVKKLVYYNSTRGWVNAN